MNISIFIFELQHSYFWLQSFNDVEIGNKLATLVKGDPKAPFSIATTGGVGESTTPFPGLLHFTLDLYLIMLSKEPSSSIFWVFGMTQPGIEPWSPRVLANTLLIRPMA